METDNLPSPITAVQFATAVSLSVVIAVIYLFVGDRSGWDMNLTNIAVQGCSVLILQIECILFIRNRPGAWHTLTRCGSPMPKVGKQIYITLIAVFATVIVLGILLGVTYSWDNAKRIQFDLSCIFYCMFLILILYRNSP